MNYRFLSYLMALLFATPFQVHGDSRKEQEAALNKIFAELESESPTTKVDREANRYGAIYIEMVQKKLGETSSYKHSECRLVVNLSVNGMVEHVKMSNQSELCRKSFNAIWDIDTFPFPDDKVVAEKLRNISLTIVP